MKAETEMAELQLTANKFAKAVAEVERLGSIANKVTEELKYCRSSRDALAAAHDELAADLLKCREDRDTVTATAKQQVRTQQRSAPLTRAAGSHASRIAWTGAGTAVPDPSNHSLSCCCCCCSLLAGSLQKLRLSL